MMHNLEAGQGVTKAQWLQKRGRRRFEGQGEGWKGNFYPEQGGGNPVVMKEREATETSRRGYKQS